MDIAIVKMDIAIIVTTHSGWQVGKKSKQTKEKKASYPTTERQRLLSSKEATATSRRKMTPTNDIVVYFRERFLQ
jgi:hypothetical protein